MLSLAVVVLDVPMRNEHFCFLVYHYLRALHGRNKNMQYTKQDYYFFFYEWEVMMSHSCAITCYRLKKKKQFRKAIQTAAGIILKSP